MLYNLEGASMTTLTSGFGAFLESLRGNLSLRAAAKLSGLSHAYIRDLELERNRSTNDKIIPSPETLRRLAKAYDYPYLELYKKAGFIEAVEENVMTDITKVSFETLWYVKIERDHILCCIEGCKHKITLNDYFEFANFLESLKVNQFIRIDANLYASFKHIRYYEEKTGRIYFSDQMYLVLSALKQSQFHHMLSLVQTAPVELNLRGMNC
jgi:transcriptional regulator with XRE-family HTH domain